MRGFLLTSWVFLHERPSSLEEVLWFENAVTMLARYWSSGASPLCSWSVLGVPRAYTQGRRSRDSHVHLKGHSAARTFAEHVSTKGYGIQAETPGRHHITISESFTCFSDPKVLSLKSSPENEGMQKSGQL